MRSKTFCTSDQSRLPNIFIYILYIITQMSTQQWIAQKFASYTIATSSIPLEFQLSDKTETLAQQNIPLYTMRKELEVQIEIRPICMLLN